MSQEPTQVQEKKVYEYQPTDREGKPLGRLYRLEYTDDADLIKQLSEAKQEGDRFIHEVKTGKRQVQGEAAIAKPSYQPVEATEDADKIRREALRKDVEAELGAPLDSVRDTLKRASDFDEYLIANQWAVNAESNGYYVCSENANAIAKYLRENKLRVSEKNLDLALEELRDTLVTKPAEIPVTPTQDDGASGATQPARSNNGSTGIQPGNRRIPTPQKPKLTPERFREINRMSAPQWRMLQRHSPSEATLFLEQKHGPQSA